MQKTLKCYYVFAIIYLFIFNSEISGEEKKYIKIYFNITFHKIHKNVKIMQDLFFKDDFIKLISNMCF